MYPRADDAELMLRALRALWEVLWAQMRGVLDGEGPWGKDSCDGSGGELADEEEHEDGGGALAVLVVSGTAVVLEMARIRQIVEDVVAAGDPGTGCSNSNSPSRSRSRRHVHVETIPIILVAEASLVQARLRARVLGEELQEHLDSSRMFRQVLAEWEPELEPADAGADADDKVVVVRRVDSGRELREVVEDVLRGCGL